MPDLDDDFRTPGQFIKSLMEARGWTNRVLAIILGIDEASVQKIVAGKRNVNADLAIGLGEVFGLPAERFSELQARYALAQARIRVRPDPSREQRARIYGQLPIGEMIKRGWLDAKDSKDVAGVEASLIKFFGVETLDSVDLPAHAARRTDVLGDVTWVQRAWLRRVRVLADEMLVAQYSPRAVSDALAKLKPLLASAEAARKVSRILSEAGIRFVLVQSLPSAKIDGVCTWLDERSPVIGMTLRHDRIDNFWFVLRHELEHVLRLHGQDRPKIDTELDGVRAGVGAEVDEEERLANEAASEFCIPRKSLDAFIARKAPFFAERDILGFANACHIHPGIVAGQLQHRTGRYDRFRAHQVHIRSIVSPGTMVDGWGDVAPID